MLSEDTRVRELQLQLEEWQAELDRLEAWPETRIDARERIEALRAKLFAGAETLRAWREGGPLEIP